MRRAIGLACFIFTAFLLGACGGGGGGGGGGNDSSSNGGGGSGNGGGSSTTPALATITRSNAKLLSQAALAPALLSDEALNEIFNDFAYFHSLVSGQSTVNTTNTCPGGGTAKISGTLSTTSNTGDMTIEYSNCVYPYYWNNYYSYTTLVYNGSVHFKLNAIDSLSGQPTSFEITYTNYRTDYRDTNNSVTSSGSIQGSIKMVSANTISAALTLTDLQNNIVISTSDYQSIYTNTQNTSATQHSGHVTDSRWGQVIVTPDTTIADTNFITGAGNSKIRASGATYSGYFDLALDENGDGTYDSFTVGFASEFDTTYSTNTAPTVNVDYSAITPGMDDSVTIPLNGIYDNESDFLSYSAHVVQTPNNVDIGFSMSENKSLSFHTDGAGDYVITLTVDDGNGGVTTQTISMHVSLPTPQITPTYNSNLNVGDNVTINLHPSNGEAGPFTYKLSGAPAGMTIDNNGVVQWQAGHNFFPQMEVQAIAQISNSDHTVNVPLNFLVRDSNKALPLTRTDIAGPSKAKNTFVLDFNNDGNKELLTTDNGVAIFTMKYSGGTYAQDWMYPFAVGKGNIEYIYPFDLDHNGKYEIAVQTGRTISIINETHDAVVRSVDISGDPQYQYYPYIYSYGLFVGDIDNDGKQEIVTMIGYGIGPNQIVVLDAATLTEKWRTGSLSLGNDFAVGNVDADSALEIVTSGGYVFDGATHANEWLYSSSFGSQVLVGDIDGDSVDDIVTISGYNLTAFSAVSKTQLWQSALPNYSSYTVSLAQLDNDAAKEIVANDSSLGHLYIYDATGSGVTTKWSTTYTSSYTLFDTIVADANNDNAPDIILFGTYGLQIFDASSHNSSFSYRNSSGPIKSFTGGLVTSVNASSLALFVQSAYYNSTQRLVGLDIDQGSLQNGPNIYPNSSSTPPNMCLADYDNDSTAEVFVTASANAYSSNEKVVAFDFATATKEWSRMSSTTNSWNLLTCNDFNNDGHIDVAGAFDGPLEIDDPTNQNQIWTDSSNSAASQITNADLDSDGKPELITLDQGSVKVFKRNGNIYQQSNSHVISQNYYYFSGNSLLSSIDIDSDGKPEIIATIPDAPTYGNTTLVVLNSDLTERSRVSISGTIDAIAPESIGNSQLVIEMHYSEPDSMNYFGITRYRVEAVDTVSGNWIWRSPTLLAQTNPNSLHVYNAGSMNPRLIMGTQSAALITH